MDVELLTIECTSALAFNRVLYPFRIKYGIHTSNAREAIQECPNAMI